MKTDIIGHYDIVPEIIPAEGDIFIRLKPIDLSAYWKRVGVLANFAAAFYAYTQDKHELHENTISTVLNEFIENAIKYSVKKDAEVNLHMKLYDEVLKAEIENETTEQHFYKYKAHMEKLLNAEDLDEIYMETLMQKEEGHSDSGIGLLLLLKDYPIKVGAKFVEVGGKYKIFLQAYYYIH